MKERTADNQSINQCLADMVKRFRFYSKCNRKSFNGFEQGSCMITLAIDYIEGGKCRSLGVFEIIQVRDD